MPEESIAEYEETLEDIPKSEIMQLPYQLKTEGNRYVNSQSYTLAIQSYVKALIVFRYLLNHSMIPVAEQVMEYIETVEKPVHLNLALAYLKAGNNNAAIFHSEKALEIAPQNCKALYRIALGYTNKAEYEKAEIFLQRAMTEEPYNEEIRALRGRIKKEKKEYMKQYTEISRKVFQRPQNGLSRWENFLLNILAILISAGVTVMTMVVKLVVNVLSGVVKETVNYAMSFWFIRIPINIWIVIPCKIAMGIIGWVLARMEEAAEQPPP